MLLYLTTGEPWNANYCTEDGQVIYKVVSPFKWVGRRATIDKVIPNEEDASDMRDRFRRIGEIEFIIVEPTKITWKGVTQETTAMFRKGERKWGDLGSDRIFTGPDGLEYRWNIGGSLTRPTLYLNDEPKTVVAKYHRKHLGIVHKVPRPATLEISEQAEHMADIIVITLAYVEKLRRDRDH
ncbi:hypothetical protein BKA70DRAFT_1569572 [Coprinopsis sp. MPI-PUGE-AT-0042]|nr:hypothetical protein BKA70DRAFT_1569572 [Coprinopsis sp. MPI-PUGE-AT-0042]